MNSLESPARRRGRPPKQRESLLETREQLLRAGLEVLTEKGFSSSGLEEILKRAAVPKGSFYHYFSSKDAFGLELIERYASYFAHKLERHFSNEALSPLSRIKAFMADAQKGMKRSSFQRGCLVGNLGQEMGNLPESFRDRLNAVFLDWQKRFADCLRAAQLAGEIPTHLDCDETAAFFWIGWEGAVMRSKLQCSSEPLQIFARGFLAGLKAN